MTVRTSSSDPEPPRRFRMPQRDLLILIVAVIVGVGAGLLLDGAGVVFGHAVIGGVTAFAAALMFVDRILD